MPAPPHTAGAVAEQPAVAASLPAAKLLLSETETADLLPPAAPASPPPPPSAPAPAPLVPAAALEAIADVMSQGEASGDAEAVAELVSGLEAKAIKVSREKTRKKEKS